MERSFNIRFSQMYRHLDKCGADTSGLALHAPRLLQGEESVWEFDNLSDIELTAYKTALEGTITMPAPFMDVEAASSEHQEVLDEMKKRNLEGDDA